MSEKPISRLRQRMLEDRRYERAQVPLRSVPEIIEDRLTGRIVSSVDEAV
jgi:hypothetical protein